MAQSYEEMLKQAERMERQAAQTSARQSQVYPNLAESPVKSYEEVLQEIHDPEDSTDLYYNANAIPNRLGLQDYEWWGEDKQKEFNESRDGKIYAAIQETQGARGKVWDRQKKVDLLYNALEKRGVADAMTDLSTNPKITIGEGDVAQTYTIDKPKWSGADTRKVQSLISPLVLGGVVGGLTRGAGALGGMAIDSASQMALQAATEASTLPEGEEWGGDETERVLWAGALSGPLGLVGRAFHRYITARPIGAAFSSAISGQKLPPSGAGRGHQTHTPYMEEQVGVKTDEALKMLKDNPKGFSFQAADDAGNVVTHTVNENNKFQVVRGVWGKLNDDYRNALKSGNVDQIAKADKEIDKFLKKNEVDVNQLVNPNGIYSSKGRAPTKTTGEWTQKALDKEITRLKEVKDQNETMRQTLQKEIAREDDFVNKTYIEEADAFLEDMNILDQVKYSDVGTKLGNQEHLDALRGALKHLDEYDQVIDDAFSSVESGFQGLPNHQQITIRNDLKQIYETRPTSTDIDHLRANMYDMDYSKGPDGIVTSTRRQQPYYSKENLEDRIYELGKGERHARAGLRDIQKQIKEGRATGGFEDIPITGVENAGDVFLLSSPDQYIKLLNKTRGYKNNKFNEDFGKFIQNARNELPPEIIEPFMNNMANSLFRNHLNKAVQSGKMDDISDALEVAMNDNNLRLMKGSQWKATKNQIMTYQKRADKLKSVTTKKGKKGGIEDPTIDDATTLKNDIRDFYNEPFELGSPQGGAGAAIKRGFGAIDEAFLHPQSRANIAAGPYADPAHRAFGAALGSNLADPSKRESGLALGLGLLDWIKQSGVVDLRTHHEGARVNWGEAGGRGGR